MFSDALEYNRNERRGGREGPDGCLSDSRWNAMLREPGRFTTTFVEDTWQEHCESISRADFWVMLGNIALGLADPTGYIERSLPFKYVPTLPPSLPPSHIDSPKRE